VVESVTYVSPRIDGLWEKKKIRNTAPFFCEPMATLKFLSKNSIYISKYRYWNKKKLERQVLQCGKYYNYLV
jgi:hypothetical protein